MRVTFVDAIDAVQELLHIDIEFNLDLITLTD